MSKNRRRKTKINASSIHYRMTDRNISKLMLIVAKSLGRYSKEDVDLCLMQPLIAVASRKSLVEFNKSYIAAFGKSEAQAQIEYRLEMWDSCELVYPHLESDNLMILIKLGVQYCYNHFLTLEAVRGNINAVITGN